MTVSALPTRSPLPGLWWSLSTAALFAATFPVWRPDNDSLLPQIPLFEWGFWIPQWLEWVSLAGGAAGTAFVAVLAHQNKRVATGVLLWILSTGLLVVADQLRFQPWWIHLTVAGVILACASPRRIPKLWTLFLVGMYGWSAWSKWDSSFFVTHGPELVSGLMRSVGLKQRLSPELLSWGAVLLPLGESVVAALLLLSRTRRFALFAAVGMHILLGLSLGPTGLNHSRGVLVWNAVCVAQLVVLIVLLNPSTTTAEASSSQVTSSRGDAFAASVLGLVMLFPLLEPRGWCDPWWAWELYASRPARADLFVARSLRSDSPSEIRRYIEPEVPGREWCRVRIDKWALEELSVPVAPGSRVQLAIAAAICERNRWEGECRVDVAEAADRLTGKRMSRTIIGIDAIKNELESFRLNIEPRDRQPGG